MTCDCGRLRQERRCGAVRQTASKEQPNRTPRLPALSALTCDDECARLERNRSLAAALGVGIDESTTTAATSASIIPYSTETLDMYMQLASTTSPATLQTYESTLHSLATSPTQRSVRFQPAKPALRAFTHFLAADWGFATESFDPEPHRHVFVLKPTSWAPVRLSTSGIGIGGMTVGEGVKKREQRRMKERESQRVAAMEAKAQRETAKMDSTATAGGTDGGWAQVASRRNLAPIIAASSSGGGGVIRPNPAVKGSIYMALAAAQADDGAMDGKKERLVLRSAKQMKRQSQREPEVVDSWEEEEEREEKEEQKVGSIEEARTAEEDPAAV